MTGTGSTSTGPSILIEDRTEVDVNSEKSKQKTLDKSNRHKKHDPAFLTPGESTDSDERPKGRKRAKSTGSHDNATQGISSNSRRKNSLDNRHQRASPARLLPSSLQSEAASAQNRYIQSHTAIHQDPSQTQDSATDSSGDLRKPARSPPNKEEDDSLQEPKDRKTDRTRPKTPTQPTMRKITLPPHAVLPRHQRPDGHLSIGALHLPPSDGPTCNPDPAPVISDDE